MSEAFVSEGNQIDFTWLNTDAQYISSEMTQTHPGVVVAPNETKLFVFNRYDANQEIRTGDIKFAVSQINISAGKSANFYFTYLKDVSSLVKVDRELTDFFSGEVTRYAFEIEPIAGYDTNGNAVINCYYRNLGESSQTVRQFIYYGVTIF